MHTCGKRDCIARREQQQIDLNFNQRRKCLMRKGLQGGRYRPLSDSDVEQIHRTVLRVFSEVGVQVNHPEALEIFKKAGARVDGASRVVKFEEAMVMDLIGQAPATSQFVRARPRRFPGSRNRRHPGLPGHRRYGPECSGPGFRRPAPSELSDIMNMARLVDALENIHFYMLNVFPNDVERRISTSTASAPRSTTRANTSWAAFTRWTESAT
jgi:trimethylamine---corrinoid protein Co-methyltransferase